MSVLEGTTVGHRTKFRSMPTGTTITVRNASERKALTAADATNKEVVESSTGAVYALINGGNPTQDSDWYQTGQPGSVTGLEVVMLNNVTADTISSPVVVKGFSAFTVYLKSTSANLGATFQIESLSPANEWIVIHSQLVTTNDTWVTCWNGSFSQIRTRINNRLNGTYHTTLAAAAL